jgi:hypothetical protein
MHVERTEANSRRSPKTASPTPARHCVRRFCAIPQLRSSRAQIESTLRQGRSGRQGRLASDSRPLPFATALDSPHSMSSSMSYVMSSKAVVHRRIARSVSTHAHRETALGSRLIARKRTNRAPIFIRKKLGSYVSRQVAGCGDHCCRPAQQGAALRTIARMILRCTPARKQLSYTRP